MVAKSILWVFITLVQVSKPTHSFRVITTQDGCPYTIDNGNYGIVYVKPPECTKMGPADRNVSLSPLDSADSPFWTKLYYGADVQSFALKIASDNMTNFEEVWFSAHKVTKKGRLRFSVGTFLPKLNYHFYCCDWSRMKNLGYYQADMSKGKPPVAVVAWVPLSFIGRVVFRAYVFVNATDWYLSTSRVYVIPPREYVGLRYTAAEPLVTRWKEPESAEDFR